MSQVLRRSLPSMAGLFGLLVATGWAFTLWVNMPLWFPPAFAVGVLGIQYLLNPYLIQWLVPATVIDHVDGRYLTDHVVGDLVARRCADAGIPLVKLGIVDDGMPNAFTFGRTRSDARMWVTRGMLERLDERELDAVVTHEVGHVKHWDFAVMTVAAAIPMVLWLIYISARQGDRAEARTVAIGAYIAYVTSQLVVLSLSRARELSADHWSCECTGNGDALASALVKVAYGMGQEIAEQKDAAADLARHGKAGRKQAAHMRRGQQRAQSMRAMGIFEPKAAEAMASAFAGGVDPDRAMAAMRWDVVNPWGRTLELFATHPLVAHRIKALEESGLPGRPKTWSILRSMSAVSDAERWAARATFARQLAIAVAPWVVLVPMLAVGAFTGSATAIGLALLVAGGLLYLKQVQRYPSGFAPTPEVASLLERLDASPVSGIPVEVRGRIIGRGTPGYVLSPDLVVQDASGFVPLLYTQPLPFLATLFGLFRAGDFIGTDVVAKGWYRRLPGPGIELREVTAVGRPGHRARSWTWMARYGGAILLIGIGVLVTLYGLGR